MEWLPVGAAASWWVLIFWMHHSGAAGEFLRFGIQFALLSLFGLLISGIFRAQGPAIFAWLPACFCILAFTGWSLFEFTSVVVQPHQEAFDGIVFPVYAVFAGIGAVLGLVAYFVRPKKLLKSYLILSLGNSFGVLLVAMLAQGTPSGDPHYLTVLASNGLPIAGAEVRYHVYGYGDGARPARPVARGGPLLTDPSGNVTLYAQRLRQDIEGTITKAGFRQVTFLLQMQFQESDPSRQFSWGTGPVENYDQRAANPRNSTAISTRRPVGFVVYLPSAPQ